ncbi:hypothetical protein ACT4S2_15155 [Kocuria turfanensis]
MNPSPPHLAADPGPARRRHAAADLHPSRPHMVPGSGRARTERDAAGPYPCPAEAR